MVYLHFCKIITVVVNATAPLARPAHCAVCETVTISEHRHRLKLLGAWIHDSLDLHQLVNNVRR